MSAENAGRRDALELSHQIVPSAAADRRRVDFNGEPHTIFGYAATKPDRTMRVTLKRLSDGKLVETALKLPKGYNYRPLSNPEDKTA